jgi:DNA-binding GntR family transcriptional regulator
VAGQIPNPNQQAIGQALTEKAAEGAREASKVVVPEIYKPVIDAAGDAQIDLAGALQAAEKVRDSAAGTMNASTVSEGIRALEEFRAPFLPGEAIPSIIPGLPGRTGAPIPQPSTTTAEKFMAIRSALSQDVRDAEAAKNFPAARNTKDVIAELDAAFKKGVSEETFKAYENANKKFITEVIDPYRSGVTSQALSDTAHNVSQILPEKLTKAFFESDTPAHQFVTTFGRDPVALKKMGQGVGGLFRDEVMGADGLVNVEKASEFLRKNSSQLDILEKGGVRIKNQLTAITEQAATNVRQRQAFAESSAVFKNAKGADAVIDAALSSALNMDFLLKQLNADQRAGLAAIVKDRMLDPIKAGNPDAAIKLLTENQDTIRKAIGQNQHTLLLNAAQVQKRLDELQGVVPREGLYDPKVLAKQFSAPQLADLNVAANDIARLEQVRKTAAAGGDARVAAKPSTATFGALLTSVSGLHPLSWAKVLVGKAKNVMEARVAAEAVNTMYYNPQRYAAALEEAIKMKTRGETAQKAARAISNNLITRPAASVSNELANRQAP